jgi:predicted XRE-type DNA-binding protein
MNKTNYQSASKLEENNAVKITEIIPIEVKKWVENLPLNQQRYVLSLYHLIEPEPSETQLNVFKNYVADNLVTKMLQDQVPQQIIKQYLKQFHIDKNLNDLDLKKYIEQFHFHSAQDLRVQPNLSLGSVLQFVYSSETTNNLFNYILGFELIKMMFQMSWLQHERLYKLQKNQDNFIKIYIKPIQYTHRLNGIIVPKYERIFFAKRNYFVKKPKIKEKKLIQLAMATFTTDTVTTLGFLILRNLNFLVFDYEYIFSSEPEPIFLT